MSREPTAPSSASGQTHHKSRRLDVSFGGLVREAVVPRPRRRAHDHGRHRRGRARQGARPVRGRDEAGALPVRRARRDRQADVPRAHRRLGRRHHRHRRRVARAGGQAQDGCWPSPSRSSPRATRSSRSAAARARRSAPVARSRRSSAPYIHRSGAPEHIGWKVAVKDRQNALKNPYAHLKIEDISIEKVKESPMMWEPIRYLESCPSSDGACAVVLHRRGRRQGGRGRRPPAGVDPRHRRRAASRRASRAATRCARRRASTAPGTSTSRPASPTRASRSTWPSCTCRSRGTRPIWLEGHDIAEPGEGWKMIDSGETEIGGSFPVNCSGGVLSSNPIGASGLLRFAEAAQPGAGHGRRAPGRGRQGRPRPWPTARTASTSACGSSPTRSTLSGRSADPFRECPVRERAGVVLVEADERLGVAVTARGFDDDSLAVVGPQHGHDA